MDQNARHVNGTAVAGTNTVGRGPIRSADRR
jgi:hypothetical protein